MMKKVIRAKKGETATALTRASSTKWAQARKLNLHAMGDTRCPGIGEL